VEPEGVVNALRKIHGALVRGGLVIDTQPVSALPPVEQDSRTLGALDMRDWARTIRSIDRQVADAIRAGLFELLHTAHFRVADEYDDGQELVAVTRGWDGTRVDDELAALVSRTPGAVRVAQAVRLRVLRVL
jgi:hypothetical protein